MKNVLRFVQVLALGTWIGALLYFSSVVTIAAFRVLTRDQAGALVGATLGGLHALGMIAAIIYVIAGISMAKSLKSLFGPAVILVMLMFLLSLASQTVVIPRMDVLRAQMGSVDSTPTSNPLRVEFDRLHSVSVKLEGGVLLAGLVALFLTVYTKPIKPVVTASVASTVAIPSNKSGA
jgi:hypothetical protein